MTQPTEPIPTDNIKEAVSNWFHERVQSWYEEKNDPDRIWKSWGEEMEPGMGNADIAAVTVIIDDAVGKAIDYARGKTT